MEQVQSLRVAQELTATLQRNAYYSVSFYCCNICTSVCKCVYMYACVGTVKNTLAINIIFKSQTPTP